MLALAATFLPVPETANARAIRGIITGVQNMLRRTPASAELLRANNVSRWVSRVSVCTAVMLAVGVNSMPTITSFFISRRSVFPRLPLPIWPPPCSPDSDWCEISLLVFECSLVTTISLVYACFTTIHVSLIVYLAELLRVPAVKLHSTLQAASELGTFDAHLDREINSTIAYHHDVIRLLDHYNECFAGTMFTRHLLTLLFISASALLFMTDPSNLQAFSIVVFTLVSMGLFAYLGEQVNVANDDMHTAVYTSGWENMPTHLRLKLCLILCRANRPIGVRGTFIGFVTFPSFLQLVRSSYTVLQFLFQMQF
ncbi:odorant receptor Or2-like isoform X2 [Frankliniella occidentalis]|nr:odorant receptor Or2-like isoform X2 [Frankliniella occidentalis]